MYLTSNFSFSEPTATRQIDPNLRNSVYANRNKSLNNNTGKRAPQRPINPPPTLNNAPARIPSTQNHVISTPRLIQENLNVHNPPPPPTSPAPPGQPTIINQLNNYNNNISNNNMVNKGHRPPPPAPRPNIAPKPKFPQVTALYDYDARDTDELTFQAGDILELVQEDTSGWWTCMFKGKKGFCPGNYVQKI